MFPAAAPVVARLRVVQVPSAGPHTHYPRGARACPISRSAGSAGSLGTVEEGDECPTPTPRGSDAPAAPAAPAIAAVEAAESGGRPLTVTLCGGCVASLRAHAPAALDVLSALPRASPPPSPPRPAAAGAGPSGAPCTCGLSIRAAAVPAGVRLLATPLSRSLHSEAGQLAMQCHADAAWPGQGAAAPGGRPRHLFQQQKQQSQWGRFDPPAYVVAWERRQTDTLPDCRVPAALVALARYVNPF